MKIKNIQKFVNPISKEFISKPKLEFFINQRHDDGLASIGVKKY